MLHFFFVYTVHPSVHGNEIFEEISSFLWNADNADWPQTKNENERKNVRNYVLILNPFVTLSSSCISNRFCLRAPFHIWFSNQKLEVEKFSTEIFFLILVLISFLIFMQLGRRIKKKKTTSHDTLSFYRK